jgi:hypothetical protein
MTPVFNSCKVRGLPFVMAAVCIACGCSPGVDSEGKPYKQVVYTKPGEDPTLPFVGIDVPDVDSTLNSEQRIEFPNSKIDEKTQVQFTGRVKLSSGQADPINVMVFFVEMRPDGSEIYQQTSQSFSEAPDSHGWVVYKVSVPPVRIENESRLEVRVVTIKETPPSDGKGESRTEQLILARGHVTVSAIQRNQKK